MGRRHPVAIGAAGNIKSTLEALLPRLEQHEDGRFLEAYVERFRKDLASAKAETVTDPGSAVSGTYLTKSINERAAEDASFAADDGTAAVGMLRLIETGGKRQTFASLLHGTMASWDAIGAWAGKVPTRPAISLSGRRRRVPHAAR
jgi:pyruvate dehydrogenase (quinone)